MSLPQAPNTKRRSLVGLGCVIVLAGLVAGVAGAQPFGLGQIAFGNISGQLSTDANLFWDSTFKRLGIGTASPSGPLHIGGAATSDLFAGMGPDLMSGPAFNFGYAGSSFGQSSGFLNVRPDASATPPNPSLRFLTANVQRMIITNVGDVGIGTTAPANKLHVAGSITVDGNINAKYQDVAEWVPASAALPAGTLVVIDRDRSNAVVPSNVEYDTRIAGVVTEMPGVLLGEAGEDKAKVATTGRVRVRATASNGAIRLGDLLVTSNLPGVAMRSVPAKLAGLEFHRPGTLIGKALEPLSEGEGEILVLLSLQ